MKLKDEDNKVEVGKFNFHEVRFLFLICYLGGSRVIEKCI